jgi:hypothetical protein
MLAGLTLSRSRAEMLGLEFMERFSHSGKVVDKFAVVTKELDASLKLANLSGKMHLPHSCNFVCRSTNTKAANMVSQ